MIFYHSGKQQLIISNNFIPFSYLFYINYDLMTNYTLRICTLLDSGSTSISLVSHSECLISNSMVRQSQLKLKCLSGHSKLIDLTCSRSFLLKFNYFLLPYSMRSKKDVKFNQEYLDLELIQTLLFNCDFFSLKDVLGI